MLRRPHAVPLVMTLALGCPAPGQAVVLLPRHETGQTSRYTTHNRALVTQRVPGQGEVNNEIVVQSRLAMTPTRADPETGATISVTVDRLALEMIKSMGLGHVVRFDSDVPEADAEPSPFDALRETIGRDFQLRLDPFGNIWQIRGLTEILPADRSGGWFEQMVTAGVLNQTLTSIYTLGAPPEGVEPGQSWSLRREVLAEGAGVLVVDQILTLESVEEGVAIISASGSIEILPPMQQPGRPPATPMVIRTSAIDGVYRWDVNAGSLEAMRLGIDATIANPGEADAAIQFEFKVDRGADDEGAAPVGAGR